MILAEALAFLASQIQIAGVDLEHLLGSLGAASPIQIPALEAAMRQGMLERMTAMAAQTVRETIKAKIRQRKQTLSWTLLRQRRHT